MTQTKGGPWLFLGRLARPFFKVYSRFSRGVTLGVRGLVFDQDGKILLVRHTYIPGWHLPGGGVEPDQTGEAALVREMAEEGGVEVIGRPRLISVHDNRQSFRGDHILLYRVLDWRPCSATAHLEIAEIGWFSLDQPPEGTTRATRARLQEFRGHEEPDCMW